MLYALLLLFPANTDDDARAIMLMQLELQRSKPMARNEPAKAETLPLVPANFHYHFCRSCNSYFAHAPGGSHYCPNCGAGEWLLQVAPPPGGTKVWLHKPLTEKKQTQQDCPD